MILRTSRPSGTPPARLTICWLTCRVVRAEIDCQVGEFNWLGARSGHDVNRRAAAVRGLFLELHSYAGIMRVFTNIRTTVPMARVHIGNAVLYDEML